MSALSFWILLVCQSNFLSGQLLNQESDICINLYKDVYDVMREIADMKAKMANTDSKNKQLQEDVKEAKIDVLALKNENSALKTELQLQSNETRLLLDNLKTTINNIKELSSVVSSLEVFQNNMSLLSRFIFGIRLVGGNYSGEGRLEVLYNGTFWTVCDDSFSDTSAKVACRQLGYTTQHATFKYSAAYGQGTGGILLDDVVCTGQESSIAVCPHNGFASHNCGHGEDVGVICFDIRLVGGRSSREGRVEIKVGNTWGTVCDDSWDVNDARVVCRTLGFSTGSAAAYSSAHFGQGSGPILMDDVSCTGSERSLALCPFRGFGRENCGHSEDAGVACP